jgi:N6-adenosine-specific RNA methylase IME4
MHGEADIRLAPHGRKLELFGRKHNTRPGWLTLGNQCTSTHPIGTTEDGERADGKWEIHRSLKLNYTVD